MKIFKVICTTFIGIFFLASSAHAALTPFKTFTGSVGVSTDGWGSLSQAGTISASAPLGSTVLAAYLYTSTANNGALSGVGGTLAGNAITYSSLGLNSSACCQLTAARADVTSIIKPIVDGGAGGVYNFSITETSASQDGSALVVVYKNSSLGTSTVGILDGFAAVSGDNTMLNFLQPINKSVTGFKAEMMLGIGFSCCGQESTVNVNGNTLTTHAGNNDDGDQVSNGALITVGGFDDPMSPSNPSYANDHERYDLASFITNGDISIGIDTFNSSHDDNIFLAVFDVTGTVGINEPPVDGDVPEPSALALLAIALLSMGYIQSRKI